MTTRGPREKMTLLWAQERDLRRNNLSKPQSQTSSLQNCEGVSHSVVSNSLRPHGLKPAGLFISWYSPGKNTKVGSHSLLHGIFLTQGSNPHLLCFLNLPTYSLPLVPPRKHSYFNALLQIQVLYIQLKVKVLPRS